MPQTKWLKNNRNLFLMDLYLEAGKFKGKMLADSMSGEDPLPGP